MGTHTLRDNLDKPVAVSGEWFGQTPLAHSKADTQQSLSVPLTGPQRCSDLLPTGAKGALGRGQDLWQPLGRDALEMPSLLCTHV